MRCRMGSNFGFIDADLLRIGGLPFRSTLSNEARRIVRSVLAKTEKREVWAVLVLPTLRPNKRYPLGIRSVFADYRVIVLATIVTILSKASERSTGMENAFKDCIVCLSFG